MAIDINRGTAGLMELPAEVSQDIWAQTLDNSVVQRLARKIELPSGGLQIETVLTEPEAGWVGETDEKPVNNHTFGSKIIAPYKVALIELFSDEFRRDKGALYEQLVQRLPGALGRKFDRTVFGHDAAPGDNFDTLAAAPEVALTGSHEGYVNALTSVAEAGGDLSHWVLSPTAEIGALNDVDAAGKPLFLPDVQADGTIGSIYARPAVKSRAVAEGTTVGIAGDWSQAVWGSVEGIKIKFSDQATITKGSDHINLWQRNMFAVLVEAELGFRVADVNRFAKLTKDADANP